MCPRRRLGGRGRRRTARRLRAARRRRWLRRSRQLDGRRAEAHARALVHDEPVGQGPAAVLARLEVLRERLKSVGAIRRRWRRAATALALVALAAGSLVDLETRAAELLAAHVADGQLGAAARRRREAARLRRRRASRRAVGPRRPGAVGRRARAKVHGEPVGQEGARAKRAGLEVLRERGERVGATRWRRGRRPTALAFVALAARGGWWISSDALPNWRPHMWQTGNLLPLRDGEERDIDERPRDGDELPARMRALFLRASSHLASFTPDTPRCRDFGRAAPPPLARC